MSFTGTTEGRREAERRNVERKEMEKGKKEEEEGELSIHSNY